jgi:hypothetical protein
LGFTRHRDSRAADNTEVGLIKRAGRTYRYHLTCAGRAVIAAASSITEYAIIPALA